MRLPRNVGEVDHNVRMYFAVPALIVTAESVIVYHAYGFALASALVGAAVFATGALRYSPVYHALKLDTRFGERARGSDAAAR